MRINWCGMWQPTRETTLSHLKYLKKEDALRDRVINFSIYEEQKNYRPIKGTRSVSFYRN